MPRPRRVRWWSGWPNRTRPGVSTATAPTSCCAPGKERPVPHIGPPEPTGPMTHSAVPRTSRKRSATCLRRRRSARLGEGRPLETRPRRRAARRSTPRLRGCGGAGAIPLVDDQVADENEAGRRSASMATPDRTWPTLVVLAPMSSRSTALRTINTALTSILGGCCCGSRVEATRPRRTIVSPFAPDGPKHIVPSGVPSAEHPANPSKSWKFPSPTSSAAVLAHARPSRSIPARASCVSSKKASRRTVTETLYVGRRHLFFLEVHVDQRGVKIQGEPPGGQPRLPPKPGRRLSRCRPERAALSSILFSSRHAVGWGSHQAEQLTPTSWPSPDACSSGPVGQSGHSPRPKGTLQTVDP